MPLSERDYRLSMLIGRRSRNSEPEENLRSLLVHRLRDAAKAVLRISLRQDLGTAGASQYQIYCEPCGKWSTLKGWAEEVVCPHCGQVYAVEFAVYSAITPDD